MRSAALRQPSPLPEAARTGWSRFQPAGPALEPEPHKWRRRRLTGPRIPTPASWVGLGCSYLGVSLQHLKPPNLAPPPSPPGPATITLSVSQSFRLTLQAGFGRPKNWGGSSLSPTPRCSHVAPVFPPPGKPGGEKASSCSNSRKTFLFSFLHWGRKKAGQGTRMGVSC